MENGGLYALYVFQKVKTVAKRDESVLERTGTYWNVQSVVKTKQACYQKKTYCEVGVTRPLWPVLGKFLKAS